MSIDERIQDIAEQNRQLKEDLEEYLNGELYSGAVIESIDHSPTDRDGVKIHLSIPGTEARVESALSKLDVDAQGGLTIYVPEEALGDGR